MCVELLIIIAALVGPTCLDYCFQEQTIHCSKHIPNFCEYVFKGTKMLLFINKEVVMDAQVENEPHRP